MGQNDFILDGMRWSFSSVNTYNTCPQAFKLGYLDALPRVDNAFSDWGTFMHSIMEAYFRGEVEFFELSQMYVDSYKDNVVCEFPPNKFCDLSERYYTAGKEYLDKFEGLFENCEVVGVEQKVFLEIDGRPFVGVIDLLIRSKTGLRVIDHKSKSALKTKKERMEYARQLYLYSLYVREKYGEWPEMLVFHMMRAGGELVEIPFVEADAVAAKRWFLETIDAIYEDAKFETTPNIYRSRISKLRESFDRKEIGFEEYKKQKKSLENAIKKMGFFCEALCSNRHQCNPESKASEAFK